MSFNFSGLFAMITGWVTKVQNYESVVKSAETVIDHIAEQVKALGAEAGGAVQPQAHALAASLSANKTALATAIAENTPAHDQAVQARAEAKTSEQVMAANQAKADAAKEAADAAAAAQKEKQAQLLADAKAGLAQKAADSLNAQAANPPQ